jgi:hypothetical protein
MMVGDKQPKEVELGLFIRYLYLPYFHLQWMEVKKKNKIKCRWRWQPDLGVEPQASKCQAGQANFAYLRYSVPRFHWPY